MEANGQFYAPSALPPGKSRWMGPRAGLDGVAKRRNRIIAPAWN